MKKNMQSVTIRVTPDWLYHPTLEHVNRLYHPTPEHENSVEPRRTKSGVDT